MRRRRQSRCMAAHGLGYPRSLRREYNAGMSLPGSDLSMSSDAQASDDRSAPGISPSEAGLAGRDDGFGFGLDRPPPPADWLVGAELGGVTLLRVLGDGGMGRVYEGLQHQPRRAVAVKVMRPGLVSAGMQRRFEHEARLLGRLSHPGIAQVHTVGMQTVDGVAVPYFVMELVPDAAPLTDHAAARGLSAREKVALFRKVCDAVAYGHHRGVIHRDLKPGNILVGPTGAPKVIDYGVARSTDADVALTTMHTDVGHLIGTLQYMSPEQFDADPDNIDTRADVYALGVVLYELLTGRPPYDVAKKPVFEAARLVRECDPAPLSSFNRTLRGDLETIAAKCLEKERTRRYSSAAELEADLGRYLAGEPIAAAPPSLFAALSRLGRRHRTAFTAAATALAALVIMTVGIGVFAVRARRERAEAVAARDHAATQEATAARERDRSQRLLSFLLDAIRNADAYAPDRDVTVTDMLDRAARTVPEVFRDDPHLQSDMLQSIGQMLQHNGRYTGAEPLLAQAVAIWERQVAAGARADEGRLAGSLEALGALYTATGRHAEAEQLLDRALATAERFYGVGDPRTAGFLGTLAGLANVRGDARRAEALFRRQLAIYEAAYGGRHEMTTLARVHVGCAVSSQGRFPEAELLFRQALETQEELLGPEHARVAQTALHLGDVLRLQRKLPEARTWLERSLDVVGRTLGPDHEVTAEVLADLAAVEALDGRPAAAAALLERAVTIRARVFGDGDAKLATLRKRLAAAREPLGREEKAARAGTVEQPADDARP
ncbi:MAG: Serine/threonine-protein kinase PknB [Planctomycetota bacterium]